MRRADRLFRIVQFLRAGRMVTAHRLAEKLQVSDRTIYRDVRDLQLSGMPIEGEAGIGYLLRRDYDMPPLMFTRSEIQALVLGARMVKAWGGHDLAEGAREALQKIEAVLPADLRNKMDETLLYAPGFKVRDDLKHRLDTLHRAAQDRRVVEMTYLREDEQLSQRRARPLGLYFWGGVWTLAAWCELRRDFRSFRVDRMQSLNTLDAGFADELGRTLQDFLAKVAGIRSVKGPKL